MSNTIRIESLDKEITFNPYTHRISREFKKILLKGVNLSEIDISDPDNPKLWGFSAENEEIAQEYLVKEILWLSQDEIDNLLEHEFSEIKEKVTLYINGKKK